MKVAYVTLSKDGMIKLVISKANKTIVESSSVYSNQFNLENLTAGEFIFTFYNTQYLSRAEIIFAVHTEGKVQSSILNSEIDVQPTHMKLIELKNQISKLVSMETLLQSNNNRQFDSNMLSSRKACR